MANLKASAIKKGKMPPLISEVFATKRGMPSEPHGFGLLLWRAFGGRMAWMERIIVINPVFIGFL
jgi:hypothetical protein